MESSLGGQQGEGLKDWFKTANAFLKDKKIISKVARALDSAGVPISGAVADDASKYDYGTKPKRKGSGKKAIWWYKLWCQWWF
ncbi:hypothetical protein DLAC_03837 [Tieghemostelium lacteum]|uniref:Uncharacterized protein n=1 Tax=Tieghemostelium lacteum TaxID=361077 RepID=A0A152A1D1_TIELA|nr:hypothetical protein DLAC_03837 [Tieghemostelium lacteum]|eukprot:KYQ99880.1 hypothetical protein DLAC_03837 [Tieghemostelium lacteum]